MNKTTSATFQVTPMGMEITLSNGEQVDLGEMNFLMPDISFDDRFISILQEVAKDNKEAWTADSALDIYMKTCLKYVEGNTKLIYPQLFEEMHERVKEYEIQKEMDRTTLRKNYNKIVEALYRELT